MNFKKSVTSVLFMCTLLYIATGIPFDRSSQYITASYSLSSYVYAQDDTAVQGIDETRNAPSKEDQSPVLIRVMIVILIIWGGIAFYLFTLDRKISRLEKRLKEKVHEV